MASVTNIDQDVKRDRESQVTKQAVLEVSAFIANSLREPFRASDRAELQAALKDGVVLCRLADAAAPCCVRGYKSRAVMPFVQMENIQLFIEACRRVFGLREHDLFVTANLYEDKDMLQVIRCLGAFSRYAHKQNPAVFASEIGGKSRASAGEPALLPRSGSGVAPRRETSTTSAPSSWTTTASRPTSIITPTRTGDSSGRRSPVKVSSPAPGVSSWSKKTDEGHTSPAWNIAQYGYMGGASQGNLGVSFGGRRQITSAGPHVPNLAEKEKRRKEQEAEDERLKSEAQEEARRRRAEEAASAAEEQRAQEEEQKRWAEETRKQEQRRREEEKRQWEEEEKQWRLDEERRLREEREAEQKLREERARARPLSGVKVKGQWSGQMDLSTAGDATHDGSESQRIKDLERQLAEARERERQYELERQSRPRTAVNDASSTPSNATRDHSRPQHRSRSRPRPASRKSSPEAKLDSERKQLQAEWTLHNGPTEETPTKPPRPLPTPSAEEATPALPSRPLPEPAPPSLPTRLKPNTTGPSSRPLPDPVAYASSHAQQQQPKPAASTSQPRDGVDAGPRQTYAAETTSYSGTSERDAEKATRSTLLTSKPASKPSTPLASTPTTSTSSPAAPNWSSSTTSKSLLEREMELERQRQQEWEEAQRETARKQPADGGGGGGVDGIGGGIGGKWDVNMWTGYTGGDGQNRGSQGMIGAGRRQIVGPRPPPGGR